MNYNKEFNFFSLFTDAKYRSRIVLLIYILLFLILIIFLRMGVKNSNTNSNNIIDDELNNSVNESNEVINDKETSIITEVDEMFSYIEMNNYNFEYTLYHNEEIYIAKGKRFEDKLDFDLTNGENSINYLSNGKSTMAKGEFAGVTEYQTADFPYYYINYYSTGILKSIMSDATKISDSLYEISNKNLFKYIDSKSNVLLVDEEGKNTINLLLKNNKIVELECNFSSSVSSEAEQFKFTLKYQDFGLVDDFEVNFE